jgi:RHS repeat-associated protein
LYDDQTAVCELSSTGSVTATNTFGTGLVSRNSAGSSAFYSFDPQGGTSQRLNASSAVLTSGMTDAFGALSGGSPSDPFTGFGARWGYYVDAETNLALLGHRYYYPGIGRFINRDPIGYAGGINLYGYCNNDAETSFDPTGFCCNSAPAWEVDLEIAGLYSLLLVAIAAITALLGGPEDPLADTFSACLLRAIAGMYATLIVDLNEACADEDNAVCDALVAGAVACAGGSLVPRIINAIPGIIKGLP